MGILEKVVGSKRLKLKGEDFKRSSVQNKSIYPLKMVVMILISFKISHNSILSLIYEDLNVISGTGNASKRASALDYSPLLRQICRTEKNRETTSRRTSRNHYLRLMLANNSHSNDYFNAQCETFQRDES